MRLAPENRPGAACDSIFNGAVVPTFPTSPPPNMTELVGLLPARERRFSGCAWFALALLLRE